ncbi:trans-sulfuration enzyme family protein, partial [Cellulomonas septica]
MPDALPLSPATLVVSSGRPARTQAAPVNPPIVLSSTYVSQGEVPDGELFYARADTETWHPFEQTLGALERSTRPALLFGSGMAAIAAALSLVPPGGRVVAPRHAYNVTLVHAQDLAVRSGLEVVPVDIDDTDAVVAAVQGDGAPAAMLWVESPTNPMLEVADVPALVDAAHAVGALVAVDNTFATPLGQRPLTLGADVVVHSVTKYLAGHSDVVLGAALADDPAVHAALRRHRTVHGAIAGPTEAWLA